jgi:hypothetical protein
MYVEKNYRTKIRIVHGYDLDGVVAANGEVGISGFTAYILSIEETYTMSDQGGAHR